jgi:hypothetical protein
MKLFPSLKQKSNPDQTQYMNTWIFNPFRYVAGAKALIIGWLLMAGTACIAYFSHTHFDGVIDSHNGFVTSLSTQFLEQFMVWFIAVFIFYFTGLFLSKSSIRLIDVAGTMALARWPAIFIAFLYFALPGVPDIHHISTLFIVIALVALMFTAWMVALMYHAFVTACNLKGARAVIGFILALLVAELISHYIIHQMYKYVSWSLK